jgi:hypothetical protein
MAAKTTTVTADCDGKGSKAGMLEKVLYLIAVHATRTPKDFLRGRAIFNIKVFPPVGKARRKATRRSRAR